MKFLCISFLFVFVNMTSVQTDCLRFCDFEIKTFVDEPVPFDIYFNDETKENIELHLTAFAFELKERKDVTGYIISYAGERAFENESECNISKIKEFLIKKKKIKANQLEFVNGGHTEKGMTYLFIIPKGADKPTPSPTIPSEQVVFTEKQCCKLEEN